MKNNVKVILAYVLAIVLIVAVIAIIYRSTGESETLTYDKVVTYFQNGQVRKFTVSKKGELIMYISDNALYRDGVSPAPGEADTTAEAGTTAEAATSEAATEAVTEADTTPAVYAPVSPASDALAEAARADEKDWKKKTYRLANFSVFYEDMHELIFKGIDDGIIVEAEYEPADSIPVWVTFLPGILLIVALIFLYSRAMKTMMNSAGPAGKMGGFGKSHVRMPNDDKNKVTFKDVAGADEEKEELVEIVEYLKDPTKYARLGAKIPHGVLLMGPPGTGKTLLAKAVAGEAGVPFFSISGSDFVEMYVGVGASRVRDLFETARKAGSAIIFIDEIDAVGRQRGTGLGGGHDEREQTLNQLLVEMDGFGSHEGIVVIAATNRADVLDPALLRPGRFDRQITVNRPNLKGRLEILKVHARNKPLEPGVDLSVTAKATVGFTGADLANLLNEAALLAARRAKSLIGMEEIEDSFNKILMGPKKKTWVMSDEEKKLTAYHEAGHAIVGHLLKLDPVHLITIVPTGHGAGGYTSFRPEADKFYTFKQEYLNSLSMDLGGRAAEELVFGDITGGAVSDIKEATNTAKQMVTILGMSEVLGPRRFGSDQSEVFLGRDFSSNADYSEEIAARIDSEIHVLITEAYARAKELLAANMSKLVFISQYLIDHEDMDGDLFRTAMDAENPTNEMLEGILAERERLSKEANEARARAEEARRARLEALEALGEDKDKDKEDNK